MNASREQRRRALNDNTVLDELDALIVGELQLDGRESFREIARRLDIAEGTVRARVRRLQEGGRLQIQTMVDPRAVGLNCYAYVGIKVRESKVSEVTSALASIEEFIYVTVTLGRFNVVCIAFAESREALAELLNQKVMTFPGVTRIETMEVLNMFKMARLHIA
jgi:DNA-binding Lrp family transcriptional regulator